MWHKTKKLTFFDQIILKFKLVWCKIIYYNLLIKVSLVIIIIIIIIIIINLTRVNQSAKAVINGCSGQLKIKILKEKTTITSHINYQKM